MGGKEKEGATLHQPPGLSYPLSTPSMSEGKGGRSEVALGVINPLESKSKEKSHFCPGRVAPLVGVSSCTPERSPVRAHA